MTSQLEETTEAEGQRPALKVDAWLVAVVGACALVAVGSIGTWVDAGLVTVAGLDTDGKVTLPAAVVALSLGAARSRYRIPGVIAAAVALGVSAWFLARVFAIQPENGPFSISVGWGLAAVALGSVLLAVLSVWQAAGRWRIGLGVGAIVLALASGVWGGSVSGDVVPPKAAAIELPDPPEMDPIPEIPLIDVPQETSAAKQSASSAPPVCGEDLSFGPNVSCQFAQAVAERYRSRIANGAESSMTLSAYSEATGSSIEMSCSFQDEEAVMCAGGNDAVISFPMP